MSARTLLVLSFVCLAPLAMAQTITATEAGKHIGEHATVCGTIASEHTATSSRGTPTFINLDQAYPNQVFTVLIWGSDRDTVGMLPKSGSLCVTGLISDYRGTPEIVLHDKGSWYVPKQ
jgi:hypothetical protein